MARGFSRRAGWRAIRTRARCLKPSSIELKGPVTKDKKIPGWEAESMLKRKREEGAWKYNSSLGAATRKLTRCTFVGSSGTGHTDRQTDRQRCIQNKYEQKKDDRPKDGLGRRVHREHRHTSGTKTWIESDKYRTTQDTRKVREYSRAPITRREKTGRRRSPSRKPPPLSFFFLLPPTALPVFFFSPPLFVLLEKNKKIPGSLIFLLLVGTGSVSRQCLFACRTEGGQLVDVTGVRGVRGRMSGSAL